MNRSSYVTCTDMFCGAGGSTTGAVAAGAEVRLAMNHWTRAIETHATNYPTTEHVLADVSLADPRRYPSTTMLLASPECTNHSLSKGKPRKGLGQDTLWGSAAPIDPAEERSRCTMWDPLRFAEHHEYQIVILENVVDARSWRLWDAWLAAWQALDYAWEIVYFNSMFAHPTPQSRDRMYCVFYKRTNRKPNLTFTPTAYCPTCEKDQQAVQSWKNPLRPYGKYGRSGQYVYRCPVCASEVVPSYYAAASAIDWNLPVQRIKDRRKPLKPTTLRRIAAGLQRHQELRHVSAQVAQTKQAGDLDMASRPPFLMTLSHGGQDEGKHLAPVERPFLTQTTRDDMALVTPVLLELLWEYRVKPVTHPLMTVVAEGNHHGLLYPPAWLLSYYQTGTVAPITEPVGTITTLERHALLTTDTSASLAVGEYGFRMLEPHEIQAAMAFSPDYTITGSRRERVRQLGNAVTPPVMHLLMERCLAALA